MMKPVFLLLVYVVHICSLLGAAQERPITGQEPTYRSPVATRQQSGDVVRIKTSVVFVDVSVRDAETNKPVGNLSLKNFQVFDDGKPRDITYFSREGDARRPLSLLLFIDVWSMYGKKHLKQSATMARLAAALRQLAPGDEVALMTTWVEEGDSPGAALPRTRLVSDFTSDRQRTISVLHDVPRLISEQEDLLEKIAKGAGRSKWEIELAWSLTDISERIMGKNASRPHTQFVVVALIDDLFALKRGERQRVAETAARVDVTFYGLVYEKSFLGKLFFGTLNQIVMRPRGGSLHAADYLAEQTGGQVMRIRRPADLGTGLERIITDLSSRYSLGFTLDDSEQGDGRMHQLDVKVEAHDARGKKRTLKVRARRGYYMPKVGEVSGQANPRGRQL